MTLKLTKSDLGKFSQLVQVDQHVLITDARLDSESDRGPNPHDLYDASLAACKAMTLLMYAERANIPLDAVSISIERDSSEEHVGKYHLHVQVTFEGGLDADEKNRLESVAAKCPIHKLMTTSQTTITTSVPVIA